MTYPREISIEDYSYELPQEKIAAYPLVQRDTSKLLVYHNSSIKQNIFSQIADHISEDSLLVFNDTRVVKARLLFKKPSGGVIEIFCIEPHEQYRGVSDAFSRQGNVFWHCLVGGASKWKPGRVLEKTIQFEHEQIVLKANYIEKRTGSFIIEFNWTPASHTFAEILHIAGAVPLPPYIKRPVEKKDAETYQTVYANTTGSVAAPTAGLHFTPQIFSSLEKKKIKTAYATLHVGAGTFKPVKTNPIGEHDMHAEWIDVDKKFMTTLSDQLGKPIVTVGTTSLRTIESLYWLGVKSIVEPGAGELALGQWEAYELEEKKIPVKHALHSLQQWMETKNVERLITKTQILIAPGYSFKLVDGLITNFHQPRSTLLLLVAAFVGKDWKKIYNYALRNEFRFLSYGDGSLLWKLNREDAEALSSTK